MFDQEVPAIANRVASLAAMDPSVADVAEVEVAMGVIVSVRGWLDSTEARFAARSDKLSRDGKGAGSTSTLTGGGRTSRRKAAKKTARSKTLTDVPEMDDALRSGDIGTDHVDSVTRAAKDLPDDAKKKLLGMGPELTDAAKRMSPDPFNTYVKNVARRLLEEEGIDKLERQKRDTRLKKWIRNDGMHIMNIQMDPETGAPLFAAIDNEVDSLAQREGVRKGDRAAALALAGLADRGAGASANLTPTEIIVVDVDTLADGLHDHSVCETDSGVHLPPETVRRLMCESAITVNTIRSADGTVLNAGRETRTANRAQRRALRSMYPTCAWNNCTIQFAWCQIHHIQPWKQGGPTDLANLVPLCNKHHHTVHEGAWSIYLDLHRTLHINEPSGRPHTQVPCPSALNAAGISKQRLEEHAHTRARFDALISAGQNSRQQRDRQPAHN